MNDITLEEWQKIRAHAWFNDIASHQMSGDAVDWTLVDKLDHIIASLRLSKAQEALEQEIADDDDITGQDNEDRINQRAADLIDARDHELKVRDPEGYAERKAMGLLQ